MRWIGKNKQIQSSYFVEAISPGLSPFSSGFFLFLYTYIFPFSPVSTSHVHSSLPPAFDCVPALLRSVHHGLRLLSVFDSHLLSFLSLTSLTVRPKLDWTVTHRVMVENKPPA